MAMLPHEYVCTVAVPLLLQPHYPLTYIDDSWWGLYLGCSPTVFKHNWCWFFW